MKAIQGSLDELAGLRGDSRWDATGRAVHGRLNRDILLRTQKLGDPEANPELRANR